MHIRNLLGQVSCNFTALKANQSLLCLISLIIELFVDRVLLCCQNAIVSSFLPKLIVAAAYAPLISRLVCSPGGQFLLVVFFSLVLLLLAYLYRAVY